MSGKVARTPLIVRVIRICCPTLRQSLLMMQQMLNQFSFDFVIRLSPSVVFDPRRDMSSRDMRQLGAPDRQLD